MVKVSGRKENPSLIYEVQNIYSWNAAFSHNLFKHFTFSLAKSLGKPYYNKGYINADELARHVLGPGPNTHDSAFRRKLSRILKIFSKGKDEKGKKQATASSKVKQLVKKEQLDLNTAARIASIDDKNVKQNKK